MLPLTLVALIALSACSESSRPVATGKGSVRGVHGIVGVPEVTFLIEERGIGGIRYKQATSVIDYDDLEYTFNFDSLPFSDQASRRLASQFIDFQVDTEYTLVLTGTFANPSIILWEAPERDFDGTETVFEIDFAHLSPETGEVDVYFAEADTAPVLGNEIGTLQYGARFPYAEFGGGTYEIIVTVPDDPTTVLFKSLPIPVNAGLRLTSAIFDVDQSITAPLAVALINRDGAATTLADVGSLPQLRLFHAAFDTDSVDGYYDSDFSKLIFPDVAFGELTPYADVARGGATLNLTAAGDPDTPVFEGEVGVPANALGTILLGGVPDLLSYKILRDDARPLVTYPVVRITSMAVNYESTDLYILEPGTPLDDEALPSIVNVIPGFDTGFLPFLSGPRELTVTVNGEKTPIGASLVVDTAVGDILDIVILDTAEPATLEIRVFDSNQP